MKKIYFQNGGQKNFINSGKGDFFEKSGEEIEKTHHSEKKDHRVDAVQIWGLQGMEVDIGITAEKNGAEGQENGRYRYQIGNCFYIIHHIPFGQVHAKGKVDQKFKPEYGRAVEIGIKKHSDQKLDQNAKGNQFPKTVFRFVYLYQERKRYIEWDEQSDEPQRSIDVEKCRREKGMDPEDMGEDGKPGRKIMEHDDVPEDRESQSDPIDRHDPQKSFLEISVVGDRFFSIMRISEPEARDNDKDIDGDHSQKSRIIEKDRRP